MGPPALEAESQPLNHQGSPSNFFLINTKLLIISEKFQGLQHTFFAYAVEEPTVSVIMCQGNSGGNIVSSEQLAQFLYRRRLDLYTIAFNFFPTIYYSKFQTYRDVYTLHLDSPIVNFIYYLLS